MKITLHGGPRSDESMEIPKEIWERGELVAPSIIPVTMAPRHPLAPSVVRNIYQKSPQPWHANHWYFKGTI